MRHSVSRSVMLRGLACAAASAGGLAPLGALAEDFPDRPITIIIPFEPGGAVDQVSRLLDKYTPSVFGKHFVFQYVPGAGGALGMTALARAKPDGYTIASFITPNLVAQPLMHAGDYTIRDFAYLGQTIADPHALVTLAGSSPYTTLQSFVAAAKASPGKLTIGIGDVYDGTRFALLDFLEKADIKCTIIPLGGGNKQNAALLGKVIDAAMVNYSLVAAEREKLNFLAVTRDAPFKFLPGVPTFKSLGYNVFGHDGRVYLAPKGVPPAVLAKLRDGIKRIVSDPAFLEEAQKVGQPIDYLSGTALEKSVLDYEPTAKRLISNLPGSTPAK